MLREKKSILRDMNDDKIEMEVEESEDLYGKGYNPVQKPYNPLDVDIIQQPLALRNIFGDHSNFEQQNYTMQLIAANHQPQSSLHF